MHVAFFLTLLVACGEEAVPTPEPSEAGGASTAPTTPAPAPEPAQLMRRPIHCCSDLSLEPVLQAYLAVGAALAVEDAAGMESARQSLLEALLTADREQLAAIQEAAAGLEGCEIAACRATYRDASEVLVDYIKESRSGDLDLAVAYSRDHDAHWIQDGVQIKSPYGDDVNSFAWGTREEVQAADAEREVEFRANAREQGEVEPPPETEPPGVDGQDPQAPATP